MKNRKKIISLLALLVCVVLCFCACASQPQSEGGLNLGKKQQTASDAATLIRLLEAEGNYEITVAEDIQLNAPVTINGNKILTGDKSLIMALNVPQYQHMLVVRTGASLTLDGAILDGNGAASCVMVESGAKMDIVSGEVIWGSPYGIESYGKITITGGEIRETINTGLYLRSGAEATMTGGKIIDGHYTGAKIEKDAYMSISDDAVLVNNQYALVYNNGKCDITGGEMHDSGTYLAYNFGDLTVKYTGSDPEGKLEWYNAGMHLISQGKTGTLTVDGLKLTNAGWHGISTGIGSAVLDLKNIEITDIAQAAFYLRSNATMENIKVENCGTAGVYIGNGSTVDIKDLSVNNSGGRGIWNFGSTVTAENVTITNAKEFGMTSTYWEGLPGSLTVTNLLIDGVELDQGMSSNQSTITVNGGVIRNVRGSNRVGAYAKNGGKLNLTDVDIIDAAYAGVYIDGANCEANLENLTVTGSKRGICAYNKASIQGKNLTINGTTEYSVASSHKGTTVNIDGLDINNCRYSTRGAVNVGSSTMTLRNARITNPAYNGIDVNEGGRLTAVNVAITKPGNCGLNVIGGYVTGTEIYVVDAGNYGIYTQQDKGIAGKSTYNNLQIYGTVNQGIASNGSEVHINGGIIQNVTGDQRCGAAAFNGGYLSVKDVTFDKINYSAVYSQKSTIDVENITVTNARRGVCAYEGGTVAGKNVKIDGTTEYSIAASNEKTVIDLTDVQITNCKYSTRGAVNVGTATMKLTNVTIDKPAGNGVDINENGTLTLKNAVITEPGNVGLNIIGGNVMGDTVTITKPGNYGIYGQKEKDIVGVSEIKNLTIENVANNHGISSNGSDISVIGGTIKNVTKSDKVGAYAANGGKLNLKDVTFSDIVYVSVYSQGAAITVDNISITGGKRGIAAYSGGSVTGKDVTIDGTSEYSIAASNVGTTVDITGLDITNCKTTKGTVNVGSSNVKLTDVNIVKPAGNGIDINENGTLTLKNAVITEPSNVGLNIIGGNVNGDTVTITKPGNYGIYSQKENGVVGKSEIKNLTIENVANNHAISSNGSDISVIGGTIKNVTKGDKVGAYAVSGGKLSLKDITFSGITYVSVYSQGSPITVDGISITGGKRGIVAYSGGSVTGKDVTIDGTTEFSITSSNTGTKIDLTDVEVTNCKQSGGGAVNVGGTNTVLTNLVIDGAAGHGINVDGNGTLTLNGATIKNVTKWNGINLNGGTITGSNVTIDKTTYHGIEVVNGNITLDGLTITNAPRDGVMITKGVADLKNVNISGSTWHGIEVKSAGELKINGGTFANNTLNPIYVEGGKASGGNLTIDSKAHGLAFSGGTGNLDKVTINSTGASSQGVNIYNKANVTLSNLTIAKAGVHGINLEAGSTLALNTASISNIGTYNGIYVNGGTLTGGGVTIANPKYNGMEVLNSGSATLDGLTVTGAPRNGVLVTKGVADLKNVNISGSTWHGIHVPAAGELKIDGGTFANNALNPIFVEGGKVTGAGNLTIDSKAHGIAVAGGSMNLTGNVNITNAARIGVNVYGSANVTIGSLTIGKTGDHGVSVNPGTLTINGGSITNAGAGTTNKVGAFVAGKSTLNLTGVTITNPAYVGVYTDSAGNTINLTNVTVDGGQRGVANYNSTLIGKNITIKNTSNYAVASSNAGTVINIDGLNISNCGATHAAVNAGGSSITLANATINGVPSGHGINVDSNGTLKLTNVSISNVGLHGVNVAGGTVTGSGLTISGAKQDGINLSAGTCEVTNLTLNAVTRYGVAVASGKTMTINGGTFTNMGGYGAYVDGGTLNLTGVGMTTLKRGIQVNNGGTVNGTDVSIQTTSEAAISANGNLTFKGLTIKGAKNIGVNLNTNAVAVMEDVLIDGTTYQSFGLYQNAKLTLSNATLINHNYGALTGATEGTNYFPTNVVTAVQ